MCEKSKLTKNFVIIIKKIISPSVHPLKFTCLLLELYFNIKKSQFSDFTHNSQMFMDALYTHTHVRSILIF